MKLPARFHGLSHRAKAVGLFFVTSVAGRAVGIACQLVQVPIAMKALGAEAFGLWMTLTGIGYVMTFADFGMGQGAQNKLAEAFAAGERERARELWASTLAFFGAVTLLLVGAVAVLVRTVDFTALFGLTDPAVRREAHVAITATLFLFCANFPLGLAQRLTYSRQEGWMHNIAQAAGGAGALAGIVIATRLHWHLPGIILATQAPLLLASAVLLAVQLARLGWLDLRGRRASRNTMAELLRLGGFFGVQQIQLALLLSLPQIVISTSLGAAAVTPYNLAQRLFNLFAVVQNAFMLPLWPAYSDAKARGEFDWVRRTLRRSLGATLACTLAPMALAAAFAHPLLAFWVKDTTSLPDTSLVWLLFAWNAVVFLGQPFGYMLAGLSEVKKLTAYSVVSTALCTVLMFLLVRRFGPQGVVVAMIVGFQPFLLLGNIAEARRVLRGLGRARFARVGLVEPAVAEGRI